MCVHCTDGVLLNTFAFVGVGEHSNEEVALVTTVPKTSRIEVRTSPEMKEQLVDAARLTGQDLSSFILDAANARARSVMIEEKLLRLSETDMEQLEAALDASESHAALVDLFRRHQVAINR